MDTCDVSDEAAYVKNLEFQKANLAKAQSQKGQRPKSTLSRNELIMQFMIQRMNTGNKHHEFGSMRTSFVPPAYLPSVKPLSELKKVMLRTLTLETHHRGSYVVLRAVTPTITITGTMLLVEDENDDVMKLTLYNQEKDLTEYGRSVEGIVMVVKEPYLKVMGDGCHGIRVDHLSDILFLSEHDSRMPVLWGPRVIDVKMSANDWKTKGNDHFNKGDYGLAIEMYAKAIESSPTSNEAVAIRLNRALSCLRSHRFDAALHDLDIVLAGNKTSEKGLFRKAQALYHLQRFQECFDTHNILAKEYPKNDAAKNEFKRATARLEEQKTGRYDFKWMQLEAKKLLPPLLDHATYVGPVAVKQTRASGRGLFTTVAVKAGDLLFCEKAFAHAFNDKLSHGVSTLVNMETNKATIGTQANLITLIAHKMHNNSSLAAAFTDLHHGSYKPVNVSEVDGKPIVDTFFIECIMSLNSFGCPRSTRASHLDAMTNNSNADTNEVLNSSGIWCLASYINHSCDSNAYRSFIGDIMIVRASRDLPANTEITFAYCSPFDESKTDPQMFIQSWGFECSCVICLDARNTHKAHSIKRDNVRGGLLRVFKISQPNISKIMSMLSALEETYCSPASEVPRLKVWDVCFALCRLCVCRNKPEDAIAAGLQGFESLGYIFEEGQLPYNVRQQLIIKKWGLMEATLIGCWMNLSKAYRSLRSTLSDAAERYARSTYRICIGEDETFDDTYCQFSDRFDGFIHDAK
ncbi:hypothetical protein BDV06DRAFT_230691 [Aspergillus oleicola]